MPHPQPEDGTTPPPDPGLFEPVDAGPVDAGPADAEPADAVDAEAVDPDQVPVDAVEAAVGGESTAAVASVAASPVPLADALVKPRLRGVFHQWAFVVSLFTGVFLVLRATDTVATIAAAVYAAGISGLFGVSALYHRITWRPNVRRWLRQLDHAMIFLLIAATYTPVGLLVLDGTLAVAVLALVWGGAIAGITLNLVFKDVPKWLAAVVYLVLGWVAVVTMPQLLDRMGATGVALIILGGLVYSVGAIVYATRRPNPAPAVFGYHEIFHLLVIAGVVFHFAAITPVVVGGAA